MELSSDICYQLDKIKEGDGVIWFSAASLPMLANISSTNHLSLNLDHQNNINENKFENFEVELYLSGHWGGDESEEE